MKNSPRKGVRTLSTVAVLAAILSLFNVNPALAAGENYLNNGIISFAPNSGTEEFFTEDENWRQAYLWRTAFDSASRIEITNGTGWGVTVTDGVNCYAGESCGAYDDNVTKSRTINYSGLSSFEEGGRTYTYGTIVETATVSLNGQNIEIVSSISLSRESNYAVITTTIKNLGSSVSGLKLLVNNYDGMIDDDSDYRSTRGNVVDGSFIALTDTNQSSNAVLADALEFDHNGTDYGAILIAGSHRGSLSSVLDDGCCDADAVAFNPQNQLFQDEEDGQYAVINGLPTLGSGDSYTLKWAFGGASYETLTSSAFLNELSTAVAMGVEGALVKGKANVPVMLRQTSNLSFSQSQYGSDTLSDPDGQLRKILDSVNAKYGNLIK